MRQFVTGPKNLPPAMRRGILVLDPDSFLEWDFLTNPFRAWQAVADVALVLPTQIKAAT